MKTIREKLNGQYKYYIITVIVGLLLGAWGLVYKLSYSNLSDGQDAILKKVDAMSSDYKGHEDRIRALEINQATILELTKQSQEDNKWIKRAMERNHITP